MAPNPTLFQMLPPPSPTPSHKSLGGWRGSLGGGATPPVPPIATSSANQMNNRPLPDPPRSEGGGSSRSGTPKSVFDTIQRPPSVQLEKIKSKASATLDRMAILQQRYRQQKARQDLSANSEQVSDPLTPNHNRTSPLITECIVLSLLGENCVKDQL